MGITHFVENLFVKIHKVDHKISSESLRRKVPSAFWHVTFWISYFMLGYVRLGYVS
jgi:hypothetical protein